MHTEKIIYRGLKKTFDKKVKKLSSIINVLPITSSEKAICNIPVEISALWDTGATLTFIKPKLKELLKLRLARNESSVVIAGVGGLVHADFTFLSLILTQNFIIEYCPVYIADFPVNFDMIIGMDIMSMGDFAVCNASNKTTFSFAMPPFPDIIDLDMKARMANM